MNIMNECVKNRPEHYDTNYHQFYFNKVDEIEHMMKNKTVVECITKDSTDFYKHDFPNLTRRFVNNFLTSDNNYVDFVDVDWRSAFIFMEWNDDGYVTAHDIDCYNRELFSSPPIRGKIMVN